MQIDGPNDLARANRALRMLNACCKIAIAARDEFAMLRETCETLVEAGGYQLAWVGYKEWDAECSVRTVARSRTGAAYVDAKKVSWSSASPHGHGPTGRALRTGKTHVVNDMATDANYAVWRRDAERHGLRSCVTFPLAFESEIVGALMIYSARPDAFAADELELLKELADIVALAVSGLRTKARLLESEERFRAVSETAFDAIVMIDSAVRVRYWNRSATRTFGYEPEEILGRPLVPLLVPDRLREEAEAFLRAYATSGTWSPAGAVRTFFALRKDGDEVPIEVTFNTILLGSESFGVGVLRDISERIQAQERIGRLARFDELTGLENRRSFVESLHEAFAQAPLRSRRFALLYLDIDQFKDVNNTLGHAVGDAVLRRIARRLTKALRTGDCLARFGGDEFGIIAYEVDEPALAASLAGTILDAVSEPLLVEGNAILASASIGIALGGTEGSTPEQLLAQSAVALDRAKSEERGTYRFFTDDMDAELRSRVAMLVDLRTAIDEEQFFLAYQPQVDLVTGRIAGMEALVRWRHPTRGLVMPGAFIAAAEHSGLIVAIGRWVTAEACRQIAAWREEGLDVPLIAVNVSALQFRKPVEFENDVMAALGRHGLGPPSLELELTESALMSTSQENNDVLLRLRGLGLRLAIDDFGNGYSSLDYLRQFPVDRIKIAQNFVSGLTTQPGNRVIVRAALGLARELGIEVVVEGVETALEFELLRSWDCTKAQGYYFSRPLPAAEMTTLLRVGAIGHTEAG